MSCPVAAQQGVTTRYVYDDLGRLRAVISPAGEAAVYEYDPAGNFTAIRRLAADALELLEFSPKTGVPGDRVTLIGVGFGAGVNSVTFNGSAAQVVSANANIIVTVAPQGATTGPITVSTPKGTVTSRAPFVIRGVRVSPATAKPLPGQTVQFTAIVAVPDDDQSVRWSVNGIDGGNRNVGTITTSGLYTAPDVEGVAAFVRATSVAAPSLFGEASVTVESFSNARLALAPPLSVGRSQPPVISPISTGVSVQRNPPPTISAISTGVSVQRNPPSTISAISTGVSVQRNPPSTISAISTGVSVQRNPPPTISAISVGISVGYNISTTVSALSPSVSITNGPTISAISPNQLSKAATTVITITGAGFAGASAILFIDSNGLMDSSITVSGINVNAGGSSVTATVTVGVSSLPGQRVVVIRTANGHSQIIDLVANTITIQ
jgi:YD repeat-containing protein